MALPANRPVNEVTVNAVMPDVSTASSTAYVVATHRGRVKRVYTQIETAITVADATITVYINGTSVGTITVSQSGAATGDVDTLYLGYKGTSNFVSEGDLIKFVSDGGSTTASITNCYAVIERAN